MSTEHALLLGSAMLTMAGVLIVYGLYRAVKALIRSPQ